MVVTLIMANTGHSGSADDVETIVGAALTAFGHGAGDLSIDPPALHSFREQFAPLVCAALGNPGWQAAWRRERVYVVAYAEAMGQRVRELAADDRRSFITAQDIIEARAKLRGYMPIAGRWCPV